MMRLALLVLFLAVNLCGPASAGYPVTPPFKLYTDANGKALNNGYLYFGVANQNPETNPVQVYWDKALTIPATQPVRTINGYPVRSGTPTNVYADVDVSITVKTSAGVLVYTSPVTTDLQLAGALLVEAQAASAIGIDDVGLYYSGTDVEAALQQIGAPGFVTQARLAAEVVSRQVPTGAVMDYGALTAPPGWVLTGTTIGSASSGAARPNADTQALYELLWTDWSNAALPIQDSAGTPTTRGATAAADFAANKRLPTPDYRNRVSAGRDFDALGAGISSRLTSGGSGITGTTMGSTGGVQTHPLSSGELAGHAHSITDVQHAHSITNTAHAHAITDVTHGHSVVDTHVHNYAFPGNVNITLGGTPSNAGAGVATNTSAFVGGSISVQSGFSGITGTNSAFAGITAANSAFSGITATNSSGSGTAHQNTQPTIIVSKIIKL